MKSQAEESQAYTRIALTLFSLSIVVLAAIWFLNRTIYDNEVAYQSRNRWQARTEEMLGKMLAFNARNDEFFVRLTSTALNGLTSIDKEKTGGVPTHQEMNAFGKRAAVIIVGTQDSEIRRQQLVTAISESFTNPINRSYLEKEIVPKLIGIDSPEELSGIAAWVAFGWWPSGPDFRNPGFPTVSYTNRYGYLDNLRRANETEHIYHSIILAKTPDDAEATIRSYWNKAYDETREIRGTSPDIGIPGVGLRLTVGDLAILAGPLLVFFQLLFLVLWARIRSRAQAGEIEMPFVFPSFACPPDPLRTPWPEGISGYAQRVVWSLFLILPSLILSFGILTRYDAVNILASIGGLFRWRDALYGDYRGWVADPFSIFLDFVNLGCLGLSLLTLVGICTTEARKDSDTKNHVGTIVSAYLYYLPILVWIVVGVAKLIWVIQKEKNIVRFDGGLTAACELLIILLFCLLWIVISQIAITRRTRLVASLSLVVATLFMLLPVMHPFFER